MEDIPKLDLQIEDGQSIEKLYDDIFNSINSSQLSRNTIIGILENIKFECQNQWMNEDTKN